MLEFNDYYIGDNLQLLPLLEDGSVDLFYIDPPFGTNRNFGDFIDRWKDPKNFCYEFLLPRIKLVRDKLNKEGNLILHCDVSTSHYIKVMLDEIFNRNQFRNEIIWVTGGNAKTKKKLYKSHDTIFVYAKSSSSKFFPLYRPYDEEYCSKNTVKYCDTHNAKYVSCAIHNSQPDVSPRYNLRYEWKGHLKQWHVSKDRMQKLDDENRLTYSSSGIPRIKRFLHEMDGIPIKDVWDDINSLQGPEKIGYATQKPVKLLERIIELYSKPNDLVVDCFAGSGTVGRACINLNRNYILMDLNNKGKELFVSSLEEKQ